MSLLPTQEKYMQRYDFDAKTRLWLKRRIGNHFDDRPAVHGRQLNGPVRSNKNLRQTLHVSYALMVRAESGQPTKLVFHVGSEFVAFQPFDWNRGIIAAIHDTDGSQYTFKGDKNQIVHWTGADLHSLARTRVRTSHALTTLID